MSKKKTEEIQAQMEDSTALQVVESSNLDLVSANTPNEQGELEWAEEQSEQESNEIANDIRAELSEMFEDWEILGAVEETPLPLEQSPNEEPSVLPEVETDIDLPAQEPAAKAKKSRTTKVKATKSVEPNPAEPRKPQNARQAFYSLDFRALDRDLSPEQEQEWNSIYASFRSRSILTGTVVGVDDYTFDITDEDGTTQRRSVRSLVIIGYRVKVMIPETEVWAVGEENPRYAIRGMVGSKVDYVIMRVDRENDCAIASRRMAMTKRRRHTLQTVRAGHDIVTCDTLLVSRKAMLVNCGGFDLTLTQRDLSYTAIADLRSEYKPGMELRARLLDIKEGKPVISVKEVNPNPFDGADQRHPVGCRRQAIIEGKYAGGVFCRLPDDTTCLCLYSNIHYDAAFETGDIVLVHITEFNYDRKLIYGRIIGKR